MGMVTACSSVAHPSLFLAVFWQNQLILPRLSKEAVAALPHFMGKEWLAGFLGSIWAKPFRGIDKKLD